jgi:pullulanase
VHDLRDHLAAQSRDHVALILENLPDKRYEAIDDANRIGADATWYDRFLFDIPETAAPNAVSPDLIRVLNTGLDFAPGKAPLTYTVNHDHSTVVNRVGGRSRWYRTQAPAIALFTSPGAACSAAERSSA